MKEIPIMYDFEEDNLEALPIGILHGLDGRIPRIIGLIFISYMKKGMSMVTTLPF